MYSGASCGLRDAQRPPGQHRGRGPGGHVCALRRPVRCSRPNRCCSHAYPASRNSRSSRLADVAGRLGQAVGDHVEDFLRRCVSCGRTAGSAAAPASNCVRCRDASARLLIPADSRWAAMRALSACRVPPRQACSRASCRHHDTRPALPGNRAPADTTMKRSGSATCRGSRGDVVPAGIAGTARTARAGTTRTGRRRPATGCCAAAPALGLPSRSAHATRTAPSAPPGTESAWPGEGRGVRPDLRIGGDQAVARRARPQPDVRRLACDVPGRPRAIVQCSPAYRSRAAICGDAARHRVSRAIHSRARSCGAAARDLSRCSRAGTGRVLRLVQVTITCTVPGRLGSRGLRSCEWPAG